MLLGTKERFLQEMWVSNSAREKRHIVGKKGGGGEDQRWKPKLLRTSAQGLNGKKATYSQ